MDTCASEENCKRQKISEEQSGQCNDDNEDKISNLPENVLHYILSFLPTKYAVGTSILSTRWRYLWTSIHNLDFFDQLCYSTEISYSRRKRSFIKFVDRVLRFNDVSNIEKFRLTCWECDAVQFNRWISKVIARKVQKLIIAVGTEVSYMLPQCLFECESWKLLDIHMQVFTKIPSSLCYKRLKVLHLKRITFSGDRSTQEVSLSCPVLKVFRMDDCKWSGIKTITISAPRLQELTINERWVRNSRLCDCEIKVYADRLLSLKLTCSLFHKYSLHNLSSLVSAYIRVTINDDILRCVGSLLSDISNVKDLELSADMIPTLLHPDVSSRLFPFSNLTYLSVMGTGGNAPVGGKQLVDLLHNMPNIQSLLFPAGLDSFVSKGQGRMFGTTPQCFLSHLTLLDLGVFSWKENEIWFVKFFMKSAKVVNTLVIKVGKCGYVMGCSFIDRKERILKQLKMLVALAKESNCVFDFASHEYKV